MQKQRAALLISSSMLETYKEGNRQSSTLTMSLLHSTQSASRSGGPLQPIRSRKAAATHALPGQD
jgi:hypothetical protein